MNRYDCVFRVDAGPGIGLGHLNRSLSLAFELQKKGLRKIALVTKTPGEIKKYFSSFPFLVISPRSNELQFWKKTFAACPPKLTVIDSYRVPEAVLLEIKSFLPFVAIIDDYHHLPFYPVDAIINYNATAHKIQYKSLNSTHHLIGLQYVPVNSTLRRRKHPASKKIRLYVSLGGSPEIPDMKKIAAALRPLKDRLQVDMARGLSDNPIPIKESFLKLIPANQAQKSMVESDAALIAVGVTAYELGFLGIPALLTVTAVNQKAVGDELARRGFFTNLGRLKEIKVSELSQKLKKFLDTFPAQRSKVIKAQKVLDGKGSQRLASRLTQLMKEKL